VLGKQVYFVGGNIFRDGIYIAGNFSHFYIEELMKDLSYQMFDK
jgi:hypothetical protein